MQAEQDQRTGSGELNSSAANAYDDDTAKAGDTDTAVGPEKPTTNPALIIAIDFGTTFSGVAWHNTASGKPHILRDWPNQTQSLNKVPTVLRYKGTVTQWGHTVRATAGRLEWFKLLLNENDYSTPDDLLDLLKKNGLKGYADSASTNFANLETTIKAIPPGKKPVDLAADYLRNLYDYVKLRIGEDYPVLKGDLGRKGGVAIKCCLTVPAIWDDKAKELTKQAAIHAGILENELYMISEPEAAAVHTLTHLGQMDGNLKIGDVYVIVDCGGGTVDLITYKVTSIKPVRVSECNIGSGGLYGSTLLNRRFEDLVISRIGQRNYDKMEEVDLVYMRDYFDTNIKPRFFPGNSSDDGEDSLTCPLPGVPDDPRKGVRRGKITFSTKEMKEIFEQTFKEITTLVQKQVTDACKATGKNVDAIILVGGFGSSDYLADWLRKSVLNKDGKGVKLIRPLDPSTAIVLGAVDHGLQQHKSCNRPSWGIVESRKARYNYGVSASVPFLPNVHPSQKRYIHPFWGIPMCSGRMSWFIRKGENMYQGVGIEQEFFRHSRIVNGVEEKGSLVFDEVIYASAADIAPDDKEHPSVYKLLTYTADLNDVPRKQFTKRVSSWLFGFPFWEISQTISLTLESADLCFTTLVGGEPYGQGKKQYHHSDPSFRIAADRVIKHVGRTNMEVFFYIVGGLVLSWILAVLCLHNSR